MTLKLTILGCGSSGGVPRPALGWGACDPANPKNRRRRCSIMLERSITSNKTVVLVDTSPDLREQLLSVNANQIDAVLFTHEHADHTHGLDDIRSVVLYMRKTIPTYMDAATSHILHKRFGYCFQTPEGREYHPIVEDRRIIVGESFSVEGPGGSITANPFRVHHGLIDALGFRFGSTAYTPDLNGIPSESIGALKNLDLWIVDALRPTAHPTHFSLPETLSWIERLTPKRAILTNLHADLDYNTLCGQLPENVTPAYDGLEVII
ncbi:MAG: MBL fold metallo-hydrolase [Beijerinckiaceae bacterium]|jgi:phosphoribosyl 1,2-cyclic phosphate phosphodiesterase|nr:MBL fold metallo-hydrolase [Beijerinckiaceae bacterium]